MSSEDSVLRNVGEQMKRKEQELERIKRDIENLKQRQEREIEDLKSRQGRALQTQEGKQGQLETEIQKLKQDYADRAAEIAKQK